MNEKIEEFKQDEKSHVDTKDDESNEEFIDPKLTDLSFPWPLINIIESFDVFIKSKSKIINEFKCSFSLQLLLFIISIVFFIHGIITLSNCNYSVLGMYFIVQGACGLFFVFIHISKIVFE